MPIFQAGISPLERSAVISGLSRGLLHVQCLNAKPCTVQLVLNPALSEEGGAQGLPASEVTLGKSSWGTQKAPAVRAGGTGSHRSHQAEAGKGQRESSHGCLLTASGNQWLRKSLNFGIPASKPTYHNPAGPVHHTSLISHLNFWPLQHHGGAL